MSSAGDLLEKAARATPATVEVRSSGWLLRHTDSAAWWSGATLAHGAADGLEASVEAAERFYADLGSTPRFQVCCDCPDDLDELLAERGYRRESTVCLLTSTSPMPSERPTPIAATCRVGTSICADWLDVLAATSEPGADIERMTADFRSIDLEQAYVTAYADGHPVGIGRAVVDGGWTGIFNMATAPQARRRGLARLVLEAIAGSAEDHGANKLYLQVEESNRTARILYDRAGFVPLTTYHYRVGLPD